MCRHFLFLCGLILPTLPCLVVAHHGFDPHYDRNQAVLIEGTITKFEYVNPHSFVYVEVENDEGTVEHWCEMQASSQLRIKGIYPDLLKIGTPIRIEGFQARRDPLGCEFGRGYLADGAVLTLRTGSGGSLFSPPLQNAGSTSIFGTWFRKAFPGAGTDPNTRDFLTVAGVDADLANDPLVSNPVYQCSPVSPIRAWSQPGLPTEIRDEGDKIIIHHEFMDTERVIHLNLNVHPNDTPRTEMGHSIGHFENEDLLVHTAMFSEGVARSNFVRTTDFQLTERFHINRQNSDLEVIWTAVDPEYYKKPLEGSRILVRTSLSLGNYDCVPGTGHGAQMDPSLG